MNENASPLTPHASLKGLRVLVTRPTGQADNLCRMIEAGGGVAVRLPLLAIQPVFNPVVGKLFNDARNWHAWIFTSANAVQHAAHLDRGEWPKKLAAVGAATALALDHAGHPGALHPAGGASAEALLREREFMDVSEKKILIVTGEDGSGTLLTSLRARGAQVQVAAVYRRVPLPYPPETVGEALRKINVLVITSGEAIAHLAQLTPEPARARLKALPLVVPSARVVEQARQLGFEREPLVSDPMSDATIVRCLETLTPKAAAS